MTTETKRRKTKKADTAQPEAQDALAALLVEFTEAVDGFAAQTVWKQQTRPFRETLAAARATAALGKMLVEGDGKSDGFEQADAARILADQCLNNNAGYRKCQWQHERMVAAVTARVLLALWGRAAGEEAPVTEAADAVAKLKLAAGGGRQ